MLFAVCVALCAAALAFLATVASAGETTGWCVVCGCALIWLGDAIAELLADDEGEL